MFLNSCNLAIAINYVKGKFKDIYQALSERSIEFIFAHQSKSKIFCILKLNSYQMEFLKSFLLSFFCFIVERVNFCCLSPGCLVVVVRVVVVV